MSSTHLKHWQARGTTAMHGAELAPWALLPVLCAYNHLSGLLPGTCVQPVKLPDPGRTWSAEEKAHTEEMSASCIRDHWPHEAFPSSMVRRLRVRVNMVM